MYNIIVCGSRDFDDYDMLCKCMPRVLDRIQHDQYIINMKNLQFISGKARGADRLGEKWAKDNDYTVIEFPADWDKYGKAAGYRRNAEMLKIADCVIAFWDGCSKGTDHMIKLAMDDKQIPVYVVWYNRYDPKTNSVLIYVADRI